MSKDGSRDEPCLEFGGASKAIHGIGLPHPANFQSPLDGSSTANHHYYCTTPSSPPRPHPIHHPPSATHATLVPHYTHHPRPTHASTAAVTRRLDSAAPDVTAVACRAEACCRGRFGTSLATSPFAAHRHTRCPYRTSTPSCVAPVALCARCQPPAPSHHHRHLRHSCVCARVCRARAQPFKVCPCAKHPLLHARKPPPG